MLIGLRFHKRDAKLLRGLEAQVRNGEMSGQTANIFAQAAIAAESGQPLELHCVDPIEAVQMASVYMQLGVSAPAIEALTQP